MLPENDLNRSIHAARGYVDGPAPWVGVPVSAKSTALAFLTLATA